MIRGLLRSTRTDTLFPSTTRFRAPLQQRMRAVLAGADRHALDVEQGGQVVRVRALDQERDHRGLAGRGAVDAQAFDLRQFLVQVRQQLLLARSEEHTSELQSLMRISSAVFCLKKKKTYIHK